MRVHPFILCVLYMAATGVLGFQLGRVLPKRWCHYDRFPYRAFPFERDGKIYNALGVRKWKDKLPDMSKILPGRLPSKGLPKSPTAAQVEVMLQETCVAELIHYLLGLTGLAIPFLWRGLGGWTLYFLYLLLGNLPFCVIQRHNRPKLARIYRKLLAAEAAQTNKEEKS